MGGGGQLHAVEACVLDLNGVVELVAVAAGGDDLVQLDLHVAVIVGGGVGIGVVGVALGNGGEADAVVTVQASDAGGAVLPYLGGMDGVAVAPLHRDGVLLRGDIDLSVHLEGNGKGVLVHVALGIGDGLVISLGGVGLMAVVPGILNGGVILSAGGQKEKQSQKQGAQAQIQFFHLTCFLLSF